MSMKRIVLAGGSGFIGRALAKALLVRGYQVVVLTRTPRNDSGFLEVEWDGAHVGEWIQHLNGAEAVVNLAGRNVNCPHTQENIGEIMESRVNSVRAIAQAFKHVKAPPRVWVQAGAVGFYGDTGDRLCDENSPAGTDTLAGVCKIWEDAFHSVEAPKTRKVLLRIGFVLGRDGGALPVLGQAHQKISRRPRGQRPAIHQLDSHRGSDADVCGKHRAGKIVRHLQRGRPQSGDEQVFHARTAPRAAPAVESARAEICRAAGRAVDEKRTVARADQPVLRADPVSSKRALNTNFQNCARR